MMVTADGMVKPCCFAPGHLGNLHDSTIDEAWNGVEAVALRSAIKANVIHPICAGSPCKFVQNMQASASEGAGEGIARALPVATE